MSNQTRDVFATALIYIKESYNILGITDPPALTLCVYSLCALTRPTITEIAQTAGLTLKTASRCLKYVRKQGLVELSTDTIDTRLKRVTLTKKGHAVEHALYQNIQKFVKAMNSSARAGSNAA